MSTSTATAVACPNIAFIKYWGNRDDSLRLPANGSISMNLAALQTQTRVTFREDLDNDFLTINGQTQSGFALERVSRFLDLLREKTGITLLAEVESHNNFPASAGLASSASAFAALALAGSGALGLALDEPSLSQLARRGSGSACRSIPQRHRLQRRASSGRD
jgi:diphosphomevalonate decarboxylase